MNRCNIVGDLLPLYVDGLTSEDSSQFIEEYVAHCPACRALLEQMRAPLETEQSQEFSNFLAAMRRRRRRTVLLSALAGLVVLILLACVLWLNVPRRVNLASEAVAFRQSDGRAENTVLHIEGEWTPDWFGGSDATFSGVIYVDGVDSTDPDTHILSEMKFSAVSKGGYLAIGFVRSAATEAWPSEVVSTIRLYRNDALDAMVVYIMDDLEEGNDWLVVADCLNEAQARAVLEDVPITFGSFD